MVTQHQVALGNATHDPDIIATLTDKLTKANEMVAEHITRAIEQQMGKSNQS